MIQHTPLPKTINQPKAYPANSFIFGKARFQFITERLVRMEWSEDGHFEELPTLAVINRSIDLVAWEKDVNEKNLILKTSFLIIHYHDDGSELTPNNLSIEILFDQNKTIWKPGQENPGNLKGTIRTLDRVDGDVQIVKVPNPDFEKGAPGDKGKRVFFEKGDVIDLGQGLISRDGWALVDDSRNILMDNIDGTEWIRPRISGKRQDLYLFGYGHDYPSALKDGALVFGRQPLPPRYAFGYWWSRFWAYKDHELEELAEQFDQKNIPIDVMVVDMDWHLPGWTGYTWNPECFPNPDQFLSSMHHRGLRTTLNLHPADGIKKHEVQFEEMAKAMNLDPEKTDHVEFNITDPKFMDAYFKILHHPEEKRGVDFWWMDWQQDETTEMEGLDTLPWINYLHWVDMENNPAQQGKRPLIFSRYGGIGAGRYCIGFSGDTYSNWESLRYQPYFTATASNVLYGYWSHDIGGHLSEEMEPELYLRWIQYGIYSPILRTHTSASPVSERRFWEFPSPYSKLMIETVRRRYELVPYIYSECRKAYDSGVSLCRPMYYSWPDEEDAYQARDQYMFGEHILVAPITERVNVDSGLANVKVWLPEGPWFDISKSTTEKGGKWIERTYGLDQIPTFVRPGTIIPEQVGAKRLNEASISSLRLKVYGQADGDYGLYQDDGLNKDYQENAYTVINIKNIIQTGQQTIILEKPQGHYKGFNMPEKLEVMIVNSVRPKSIELNEHTLTETSQQKQDAWSYDEESKITRVFIKKPTAERLNITLHN